MESTTTIDDALNDLLIDVERISIGQNQAENIKCFLCYRIPFSPLLIECCEQIICHTCVKDWNSKNQNKCPHCRTNNYKANIPNKFIKRIYENIKYFCVFKEKGCSKNDLSFDHIKSHEEQCEFNLERIIQCEKCEDKYLFKLESEHNCLKSLIEGKKNLIKKINQLENEIKDLKKASVSNSELENLQNISLSLK